MIEHILDRDYLTELRDLEEREHYAEARSVDAWVAKTELQRRLRKETL